VPYDLGVISKTLDNISAAQHSETNIENILPKLVNKTSNPIVFDLTDSIINKNLKQSFENLNQLKKSTAPEQIFSIIFWQFRMILKIISAKQKNYSDNQIIKELKISPFVFNRISNTVNQISLETIDDIFDTFIKFDQKNKTGFESNWNLDLLVLKLCGAS